MAKEYKKKINVKVNGQRVTQKLYMTKDDKLWLKAKAKKLNMSVSKLIHDLVKKEIDQDIRLGLEFED